MAPKRDAWARSRTLREGGVEANVSVNVRGCPPSRLLVFGALFEECVAKLNAAIEAVTKSEERNEQAAACAEGGQQPSNEAEASSDHFAQERSDNASLPARHAALPQQDLPADRGVSSDTAPQHQEVIPEERSEGEAGRPRRCGPALLKRKCELNDCERRSYSRASLGDVQRVFPDTASTSNALELCRPHFRKVQRRNVKQRVRLHVTCLTLTVRPRLSPNSSALIFCTPISHQIFRPPVFAPQFVTNFFGLPIFAPAFVTNFVPLEFLRPILSPNLSPLIFSPTFVTKLLPFSFSAFLQRVMRNIA